MSRRALLLLLSLMTVPSFANATIYWQISASTSPTALKSNLTPARPANFGNYTTPNGGSMTSVTRTPYPSVNYVVAVPVGYKLVNVKVDGVVKGAAAGTYTVEKGTMLSHTIAATYAAASYVISTYPATGGNISSSLTAPAGSNQTVTVTPFNGYQLTGAIIDNTSYALNDPLPSYVTKTGDASGASYTFSSVNAAHSVKGIFAPLPTTRAVISTPNQSVTAGTTGISIDGSASSSNVPGTIYDWTATCGTVTPTGPNAKTATYAAPATIGSCTVTLTVIAAGVTPSPQATVTVTTVSPVLVVTNTCLACHNGTDGPAVPGFTSSPHYGVKSCADCHNPDNNLSHAYLPLADMVNVCRNCHADAQGNVANHPLDIGATPCVACHNPHSTVGGMTTSASHFNNITSGVYPASYMTSKAACANCHVSNSSTNATVRHQWAKSGHADFSGQPWINVDFKTKDDCVRCHTTTGFIAYSTGKVTAAWGVASDKTKEVLRCNGCHSDVANGIVRGVAPVRPFADDSYVNRDIGTSNICMSCHSGRNNGLGITSPDFSNQAFVAPHYLAAGGTLHGKSGYVFPGQTYAFYSSNTHRTIGIDDNKGTGTNGPCVGCHMSASRKHLFKVVSSATNGTARKVTTGICNNCHGAYLDDTTVINARKADFANALDILNKTLEYRGFYYPYSFSTNWGSGQAGANTMGAAFNYALLLKEPGAYAHNSAYAKRLIFDSIDYLYNGTITGSIDAAVAGLVGNGITQAQADSLIAYQKSNSCSACHGSPPAYANGSTKANSHLSPSHRVACNTCHAGTTANGTNITDPSRHLNGTYDLQAGPGVSFSYSYAAAGGSCSNISCHGSGTATWGASVGCLVCHSVAQGSRAAIAPQFAAGSHHIQGAALSSDKCYQCHWEANSDGSVNPSYHGGSAAPGSAVDLVVYGAGVRPASYNTTNSATAIEYKADGSRSEIQKLNRHCISCHSDQNNASTPFGDGKTPRQYAWDGTSVAARYSQNGVTTWGKYSTVTNAAQKRIDKAYSAHGNSAANKRGWNISTGVDETITNTGGTINVQCYDCHNSHGSAATGIMSRYSSATGNRGGGILKTTVKDQGGYSVAYKPEASGSAAEKNQRNPGASICLDCHLNQTDETTPWGYTSTYGATQPILGYLDAPRFKNFTSAGAQKRFPYRKTKTTMGGHFGASSPLSSNPTSSIDGLCTPCHDPHGVSPTLGDNQQHAVPLLKGTWLTSPYKEDVAPADNIHFTNRKDLGYEGAPYNIDQNTFGSDIINPATGITEQTGSSAQDSQSAGLCLGCHPKSSLTDGETHTWKSKNRIHESVKGWKTANTTIKHNYSCSKCHAPHDNANLPRLMVTNCLDKKHKGQTGNNISPVTSDSGWRYYGGECSGAAAEFGDWGWCLSRAGSGAFHGSGQGRMPGSWGGDKPGFQGFNVGCHEGNSSDQSWNIVTPWLADPPNPPLAAPTAGVSKALSTTSIRWNFSDPANDKDGFRLHNSVDNALASSSAYARATYIDEKGLVPNTLYTRHLHSYNAVGESPPSTDVSRYTWPKAPNVTADRPNLVWYNTADVTFSNSAGFGPGTIDHYRYVWTQSWPYAFNGNETIWNGGTLTKTATANGSWYLYVKSYNGDDVGDDSYAGSMQYGPYYFDGSAPTISVPNPENGGSGAVTNPLVFTVSDADSGIDWATISIQISGNMGYAKSYSAAQAAIVTKTGSASSYAVTVKPDAAYGNGEVITWSVRVKDLVGHELVSPAWSFTALNTALAAPTMGGASSYASDWIRWSFTDNSDNETGFRLHDSNHVVKATSTYNYFDEYGLAPNTQYTRHAHAYGPNGESAPSYPVSAYTVAPTPNVIADKPVSTWSNTPITFTNSVGFGTGKVEYYRYTWDHYPEYYPTSTDPLWNSGSLVLTPVSDGNWYLHVVSYNKADVPRFYKHYGPFRYDSSAPTGLANAAPANGSTGTGAGTLLSATPASDTLSGSVQYLFQIALDSGFTQGLASSGWQSGSSFMPLLSGGQSYFWRVKARDALSNETPFTPTWTFTTAGFQTDAVTWSSKGDFENNLATTATPTVARQVNISGTAQSDDAAATLAMDRVVGMAGGTSHSLALTSDGAVWGWGANNFGELGVAPSKNELKPVQSAYLGAGSGVAAVAAGYEYSLALKKDGTLLAFGLNNSGQLGYAGDYSNPVPTQIAGFGAGSGTVAISAGSNYALALKADGSVWAWGDNYFGQLGSGTINSSSVPKVVSGLGAGSGIVAISAGTSHALALKSDGTVWAWGWNYWGQLGDGTTSDRLTPYQVPGISGAARVIAGNCRSYVIMNDGTVWGWGYNQDGALGDGSASSSVPRPVQLPNLSGITALSTGNEHAMALKSDGTLWVWGTNTNGQVGDGTNVKRSTAVMLAAFSGVSGIAAGSSHSLALKSDGSVYGWGLDNSGQVGDGTIGEFRNPVAVNLSGMRQPTAGRTIACGGNQTLAIKEDGSIWGWGLNNYGALGEGTMNSHTTPVQSTSLGSAVKSIAAGYWYTLTLRTDGTVWGVGQNDDYQLGDGTFAYFKTTPVRAANLTDVISIAAGYGHSLAAGADGSVYAWGRNWSGQVGDGYPGSAVRTPTQVMSTGSGVVAVAAGGAHSLALKSDGTVWAWGEGSYGQIGNGTSVRTIRPTKVSLLTNVIAIAAGYNHSLAVKSDGTVWAWGDNSFGQLGDGTTTSRNVPVQVLGLTGAVNVSGGMEHSLALLVDGTVKAWGHNNYGQLGDGTNIQRTSPVTVFGLSGVAIVSAGSYHNAAILTDGTTYSWGANSNGEMGQGTVGGPNQPIPVVPMSNLKHVSSGNLAGIKLSSPITVDWGALYWNGTTPANTAIRFRSRGADSEFSLTDAPWSDYYLTPGARITTPASKWLELELTLQSSDGAVAPTLDDFRVVYMH